MNIKDVVRLTRQGESDLSIARHMGLDRKTVGKYHAWAEAQGLLEGPLPSLVVLQQRLDETWSPHHTPQSTSTVES